MQCTEEKEVAIFNELYRSLGDAQSPHDENSIFLYSSSISNDKGGNPTQVDMPNAIPFIELQPKKGHYLNDAHAIVFYISNCE